VAEITVWTVEFSAESIRQYRYNATITAVTDTIERAVEMVREKYPDAKVVAVHKRSRGEILIDPRVLLIDGDDRAHD